MNAVARDGSASAPGPAPTSSRGADTSADAVFELSRELRRLAVAGVGLARGDRRIAALVPSLERSDGRTAVLACVAERAKALIDAPKGEAPAAFLRVNTLVGAVLKARGPCAVGGDLVPLPPAVTESRPLSAKRLRSLNGATYSGHTRALDEMIERDDFADARLARFALDALGSSNGALGNLAAERLVPRYGKAVVPRLLASLELSAKRSAARTLETIGRVDARTAIGLARQILDPTSARTLEVGTDGANVSDEMRVAAIGLLDDLAVDGPVLVGCLGAQRKALRSAAFAKLLALGDGETERSALALLSGSDAEASEAVSAMAAPLRPVLIDAVLERARRPVGTSGADHRWPSDFDEGARVVSMLVRSTLDRDRREGAADLLETVRAKGNPFDAGKSVVPSPGDWERVWLRIGLQRGWTDLVEHLCRLDPDRVIDWVFERGPVTDGNLALLALLADPARADELRRRFDASGEDHVLLAELCRTIVEHEPRSALACLNAMPRRLPITLRARVQIRLNEHFATVPA